jgi:hypothetical protein
VVAPTSAEDDAGRSWATRGCTASWLMGRGLLEMWQIWAVAGMEHCQGSDGCGGLHQRGITPGIAEATSGRTAAWQVGWAALGSV